MEAAFIAARCSINGCRLGSIALQSYVTPGRFVLPQRKRIDDDAFWSGSTAAR